MRASSVQYHRVSDFVINYIIVTGQPKMSCLVKRNTDFKCSFHYPMNYRTVRFLYSKTQKRQATTKPHDA